MLEASNYSSVMAKPMPAAEKEQCDQDKTQGTTQSILMKQPANAFTRKKIFGL